MLLLTEIGNKRILQRVRGNLRHLHLQRTQIRPQQISETFISSWSGLYGLKIDAINPRQDGTYSIRFNKLPSTLLSLSMTLFTKDLIAFINPATDLKLASTSHPTIPPHLTCLQIRFMDSATRILPDEHFEPIGRWIQQFPLSHLRLGRIPLSIVHYLPSTLTFVELDLQLSTSEVNLFRNTFSLLSSLTSLQLNSDSQLKWSEGAIPSSVTHFSLPKENYLSSENEAWHFLPPHLTSVNIQSPIDANIVSKLPQTLQSLSALNIDEAAIPLLPKSLTYLSCSRFGSDHLKDPSILPKSLISLHVPLIIAPRQWACLPRGLKHFHTQTLNPGMSIDLLANLPPLLSHLAILQATTELLRSLPCSQSLTELHLLDSACLTEIGLFSSLTTLYVDFIFDWELLSLITAPLKHLSLRAIPDLLEGFKLPSSCAFTLIRLRFTSKKDPQYERLTLPWISSLPHSLEELYFPSASFHIPPSVLSHLPKTCIKVEFGIIVEHFDYSELAHLPHTLQQLSIWLLQAQLQLKGFNIFKYP